MVVRRSSKSQLLKVWNCWELRLFEDCTALASVTLGKGFTVLNQKAFKGCKALQQITLPEGVEELKPFVFQNCTALTEVTFPSTLKNIGLNALVNCSSLSKVTCNATTPPVLKGNVFNKTPNGKTLVVPESSIAQYQATQYWGAPSFATVVTGINSLDPAEEQTADVYTLQGVRLGTKAIWPSLPKGLYVVGNKKVVK